MRSLASASAGALLALSGCALSDGLPWGEAAISLDARFAPEPARLTPEGWLATAQSYAVEFDTVEVTFEAVTLALEAEGGGAATFDPAHPPPGYTLCHGGHCHADDGRLVSYEEIEAELGGGGGEAPALEIAVEGPVALSVTPSAVTLAPCDGGCALPRGELARFSVTMHELHVAGRIRDLLPAGGRRLPEGGVAFTARFRPEAKVARAIEGTVDEGEPVGVRIAAAFALTPTLFDGIDFGPALAGLEGPVDLAALAPIADAVAAHLSDSSLDVSVSRFER